MSSAGEFARKKLRECEGLVDALLYVVKNAIEKANMGNKSIENCVCVLRNLPYRCQEVEDSNYDKHPFPVHGKVGAGVKGTLNVGIARAINLSVLFLMYLLFAFFPQLAII